MGGAIHFAAGGADLEPWVLRWFRRVGGRELVWYRRVVRDQDTGDAIGRAQRLRGEVWLRLAVLASPGGGGTVVGRWG